MSFMYEVKYRGCIQVTHWQPTHAQPRPGLIEANACVKRILAQEKHSSVVVLSASPETGIKCVDTNFNPPKTIMSNSVYEIAHCGVDVSKPQVFTCIVGTRGENAMFFCHVFKCDSKETASKITRAVAQVCTQAYQEHQKKKAAAGAAPTGGSVKTPSRGGETDDVVEKRRQAYRRQSMKAPAMKAKPKVVAKLTDSWFRPNLSRNEVNNVLRGARVGDFVCRESQSQPGDYAISVQTGKNIWTGLVLHSADGFQLGNKGGVLFDELTDLIAFYCENKFMNDDFGYPLTLRLPPDAEKAQRLAYTDEEVQEHRMPGWRGSKSPERKPTFKNPPLFAGGDDLEADTDAPQGYQPACGWPDDDDEGEGEDQGISFSFMPGKSMNTSEMTEKELFENFMDSELVRGTNPDDMDQLDEALSALNQVGEEVADSSDDEEKSAPRQAAAPVEQPMAAEPPAVPALLQYTQHVFEMLPKDGDNLIGGGDARPLLMKCGLDVSVLGRIWMEVDQARRGRIDSDQLGLILGMIGQAQQGQEPSLDTLYPDTAQPPVLEGVTFTPKGADSVQRGRATF